MDMVKEIVQWVIVFGPQALELLIAVMMAMIALFMVIPGEQPEKAMQAIVDFLKKFSRK
jgi:hypothetical protein